MTSIIRCDFCKNTIPPSNVSSLSYLPCLHLICANCKVTRFRAQSFISCAVCNTEFEPNNILELPDPNSLLGVCQSGLCNIKSGLPLKFYCQSCRKYLCEQCGPPHQGTYGHVIAEVEPNLPSYARCPRHPDSRVTYACSCGARVCDACAGSPSHAGDGHQKIFFRYLADSARKEIQKLKATTQQDIARFDKSLPLIEKNKSVLSDYASKMRTAVASEVVELCNAVIRRGNDIVTAIDMAEDGKMKQYNQLEHEIRIQRDRFVKLEQLADLFIRAPEPITTVNACNFLQKAFTVVGAKRESTQANYEKIQRHPFMKYESDVEPLLKALANYGQLELDGVKKTPLAFTNPNAKMFTMLNNPMMPSTSAQRPPAPAVPRLRFPINAMHMNPPAGYANQVPNGTTTPNLTNPVFQQRGVVSQGMIEMRQNSPSYPPTVSMHHMHPRQPTQPMRLPFPHVMHDPSLAGPMPSPTNMQPNHAMPQQFHSPRAQMPQMRANFPYHQLPPEFQQQVGPGFPINQAMSPQANMLHMPRMPISAPQLPIATSADPSSNGNAVPMTLASSSDNANHLSEIASPVANSPSIAAPLPTQITSANVQSPKPSTPVSDIPLVKLVRDNTGAMKATLQPRFPETASSNASTSSEKSNTDARRATTNGMSEKTETRKDSSSKNETSISKKADENLKTKDDERGKPINPEDWDDYCYVCNQGCDEKTGDLGCCSTCPRVFHNQCHIPIIEAAMADLPDDWQCSVCLEASPMTVMPSSFTDHEQLLCSKVILYCCKNNQQVEPFLYPVPKSTFKYYDIIKQPTDFSKISRKLSTFQYKNVGEFIQEMNLVFMNCSRFNAPQLQIALAGKAVYSLYIEAVKKYMPCMQKHVWIYVCLYQDKTFYEVEGDDPKTIRTKSKSPIPKKPRKEVPNPNPIREVSALNASKEIVSSNS